MKKDFLLYYSFCPRCGAATKTEGDNLLLCGEGHRIYVNPKPTNAVIFEDGKGKILLVRRKYEPYREMWDLPGGFVDLYENMEESARREIREELGIKALDLKYLGSTHDFYEYEGSFHPTICMMYSAKCEESATINHTDDVSGYCYFSKDALPLEEIGFPSIRRFLSVFLDRASHSA